MRKFRHGPVGLLLALCVGVAPGWALVFEDVTEIVGVEMLHYRDPIASSGNVGAGVVWFDMDGDGDFDLFAAQSGNETGIGGGCNHLFENLGDGNFADVPNAGGLEACDDVTWSASAADFDRDGDRDLFLGNHGQNRLMQNRLVEDGVATFVEITDVAGMGGDSGARNASSTWGDFDGDGFPDLYVNGYVSEMFFSLPPDTRPDPPLTCWDNDFWHNNGDGTFTNIAVDAEMAVDGCGLAAAWTDFDEDDDLDLFVCNDFGAWHTPNRVYRNDGPDLTGVKPWQFTEVSAEIGLDFPLFCMGIAVGDVDRDGHKDYYFSNAGKNQLAWNNGDGTFTSSSTEVGLDVISMYSEFPEVDELPLADCLDILGPDTENRSINVSWGNAFADLNNSTDQDLYVNGGYIPAASNVICGIPFNPQPNLLFRSDFNSGGGVVEFVEIGVPVEVDDPGTGRGMAMADYDQDGFVDVYVGNVGGVEGMLTPARNTLLRNGGNSNSWLTIVPKGTVGDLDAIGTKITLMSRTTDVLAQYREIFGGGAFLSQHANEAHFGLKFRNEVEKVVVKFLGAPDFEFRDLPVNTRFEVMEPTATVEAVGDSAVMQRGTMLQVDFVLTNRTDEQLQTNLFISLEHPDGTQSLYRRMRVRLAPGRTRTRQMNVFVDHRFQDGDNTLRYRIGPTGNDFLHQSFVDFEVLPLGAEHKGSGGNRGHDTRTMQRNP